MSIWVLALRSQGFCISRGGYLLIQLSCPWKVKSSAEVCSFSGSYLFLDVPILLRCAKVFKRLWNLIIQKRINIWLDGFMFLSGFDTSRRLEAYGKIQKLNLWNMLNIFFLNFLTSNSCFIKIFCYFSDAEAHEFIVSACELWRM